MRISFLSWQLCIYSPLHPIAMPSFCIEEYQYSKISSLKQDDVDCLGKTIIIIIMKWSIKRLYFYKWYKDVLTLQKGVTNFSSRPTFKRIWSKVEASRGQVLLHSHKNMDNTFIKLMGLVLCLVGDWLTRNDWLFLIGSLVVRLQQLAVLLRAHLNNLQTILINNHTRYENIT